jgi:hypothetical protein
MPGVIWMVIGGGASSHSRLAPRAHHLCVELQNDAAGATEYRRLGRWSVGTSSRTPQNALRAGLRCSSGMIVDAGWCHRANARRGRKAASVSWQSSPRQTASLFSAEAIRASYIRQKCGCSMLNLAIPHGLSAISIVSSISAMRSDVQNAVALFFRLVMTRNSLAPWW